MNSSATYIAVVIVLVILIGFVLTMVNLLVNTTGTKIRNDMQKIISSYDAIIEKKVKEIEKLSKNKSNVINQNIYTYSSEVHRNNNMVLNKELSSIKPSNNDSDNQYIPISSFILPSVEYRSSVLAENYEEIKNDFAFTDRKIKENVEAISRGMKGNKFVDACQSILKNLSFEGVYELATRKSADQVDLLKNNLRKRDLEVLNVYLNTIEDINKFDAIKFYDWINRTIKENSNQIEIRSSSTKNEKEFDSSICDGYRIYTGNKMYDYAISKKDVS